MFKALANARRTAGVAMSQTAYHDFSYSNSSIVAFNENTIWNIWDDFECQYNVCTTGIFIQWVGAISKHASCIHLGVLYFRTTFFSRSRCGKVLDRMHSYYSLSSFFSFSTCWKIYSSIQHQWGKWHVFFIIPLFSNWKSVNLNVLKVFKCWKTRVKHLHGGLFKFHFHFFFSQLQLPLIDNCKRFGSHWAPVWAS